MNARNLSSLTALVVLSAAGASSAPTLTPSTLQCDGSYAAGGNTHTSTPTIRVSIEDASVGLRVGQARMGSIAGQTRALWRFDNTSVNVSSNCSTSATFTSTYTYTYSDPNESSPMIVGRCLYTGASCAAATTLNASPQIPIGSASCPGTPPALGAASVFNAAGPQFGNAAQLNSAQVQFGSVAYAAGTWDLPANYTLSAWIRTSNAVAQRILTEQNGADYWGLGLSAVGGLRSLDSRDAGTPDQTQGNGFANNAWHQIHVVRRNGIDRRFYVDGKLLGTVAAANAGASVIGTPIFVGRTAAGAEYFNGAIDEIRVLSTALNDDDILLEYVGTVHKYSSNGGVSFSTAAGSFLGGTPANGITTSVTYTTAALVASFLEPYTATSQWIFEAQDTDSGSMVLAPFSVTRDNSLPVAPTPSGVPTSANDIDWSWATPSMICVSPGTPAPGPYYQLFNSTSGAVITPASAVFEPVRTISDHVFGPPNQLISRKLRLTDVWGPSTLSASASAYTMANPPAAASTGGAWDNGFSVSWSTNGNPSHTRYEVTYSPDDFALTTSTPVALADNFLGSSATISGISLCTTFSVKIYAYNGRASDAYGGVKTAAATTSQAPRAALALPPISPSLSASPTSPNQITWSWGTPPRACQSSSAIYYELIDAQSGTVLNPPGNIIANPVNETLTGAPNQARCRHLRVTDIWGTSPLSASVTAYSLANPPTALALANISTGGVSVSWNANLNPSHTRYEFTYSPDNFTVATSTRQALENDFTGTSADLTGLTPGTTYWIRIRAFNGQAADFSGGTGTAFLSGSFVTRPAAPILVGTPISVSSVRWDWTQMSGAAGYNLYDLPTGTLLSGGGAISFTSTTLLTNARYDAQVEAYAPAPSGAGERASARTYTLARPPASAIISAMYASSGVFTWDANTNPPHTSYEFSIATGPDYGVVIATLSTTQTSIGVDGLLPRTRYYARVRAFNGTQVPTAFAYFSPASTVSDPLITISSAPPSPYAASGGLVGSWQFDEGGGLSAADGSGNANAAQFTCTAGLCTSTPSFAAGPPGLGAAASFSGAQHGVVRTQSGTPFAFTDDLTVEAWIYPQTAFQPDNAGIVSIGNHGSEDFALDVVSNRFRFMAAPAKSATASAALAPGAWIHLAGVYDSLAASATLYLNGVAAATVTGVNARTNSSLPLCIGNRAASGGGYTLPFFGRVDSVLILHRALKPAEILADYRGSFISTITPSGPNGILVGLPPDALGAPAQVYISTDPATRPIRISRAALDAGLTVAPSSLTLVPHSMVEIVPIVGGLPFTATLGSSATVSIPYADSNGDNLVDGTWPPLPAASIRMYTLNTLVNRWEELRTSIDTLNRRAVALTPHFSVFALFAPQTVGSSLSGVRVYPVPWAPGSGGRFDGPGVVFDRLPSSGRILILSAAGERVASLRFEGSMAGRAVWNGLSDHGRRSASGVYFGKISSDAGESMTVRFAVER